MGKARRVAAAVVLAVVMGWTGGAAAQQEEEAVAVYRQVSPTVVSLQNCNIDDSILEPEIF